MSNNIITCPECHQENTYSLTDIQEKTESYIEDKEMGLKITFDGKVECKTKDCNVMFDVTTWSYAEDEIFISIDVEK